MESIMKKVIHKIFLLFYYLIARHLPGSGTPYCFGARILRQFLCKRIFDKAGKNINIEHGAFFGSGIGLEIGNNSGLGL
jgi:maltose O-acetyltransferase